MWHDPWLRGESLTTKLGSSIISIANSNSKAQIKDFIRDGSWHPPSTNHVQATELRRLLSSVRIGTRDLVLWNDLKHVTLSRIIDSVRRTGVPPPWNFAVWHSFAIPKCSIFMWLALKSRLLTKDRMINFGMNVDSRCLLCRCNGETAEHIFTSCPYTYLVLKGSPIPLSTEWDDWQNGNFFTNAVSKPERKIGWLYISVAIYMLWQERNARYHESGKPRPTIHLLIMIKRIIREKLFSCSSFKKKAEKNPNLIPLLY